MSEKMPAKRHFMFGRLVWMLADCPKEVVKLVVKDFAGPDREQAGQGSRPFAVLKRGKPKPVTSAERA